MFKDKTLSCKDCGKEFVFSASEQEFYAQKGFTNEPGRCPECRSVRKEQNKNRRGGGSKFGRSNRKMYTTTCSQCGKQTQVPFQPTGEKPVYCQDCFQPRRRNNY